MTRGEAETQMFAASLGFPVPIVRRVFSFLIHDPNEPNPEGWFTVMDFISGRLLDNVWPELDEETRNNIIFQVVEYIEPMQTFLLPIGRLAHFNTKSTNPGMSLSSPITELALSRQSRKWKTGLIIR
ncbi:hypothetical protein BX600DRAFT_524580 [Xylariales sp. PMI_506]|nr:hypothetical protein BX600DRAFT_524580 [Xylariales sp. PMI_506]